LGQQGVAAQATRNAARSVNRDSPQRANANQDRASRVQPQQNARNRANINRRSDAPQRDRSNRGSPNAAEEMTVDSDRLDRRTYDRFDNPPRGRFDERFVDEDENGAARSILDDESPDGRTDRRSVTRRNLPAPERARNQLSGLTRNRIDRQNADRDEDGLDPTIERNLDRRDDMSDRYRADHDEDGLDPTIERYLDRADNLSERDRADRDEDGLDPTIERDVDRRIREVQTLSGLDEEDRIRRSDAAREQFDGRNSRRIRSTFDDEVVGQNAHQSAPSTQRLPDATRDTGRIPERGASRANTREIGSSRLNTSEIGSSGMTSSPRGNSASSAGSGLPSGTTAGGGRAAGLPAPATTLGNRPVANPTRTLRFPDSRDASRERIDRVDRLAEEFEDDLRRGTREIDRRNVRNPRPIGRRVTDEDIRRTAEDWGDRPFEFGAPRAATRARTQTGPAERNSQPVRRQLDSTDSGPDLRSLRTDRRSDTLDRYRTSPRRPLRTTEDEIDRRDLNRRAFDAQNYSR
jgi:hypothetical protein